MSNSIHYTPITAQQVQPFAKAIAEAIHPDTLDLSQAMVEVAELPFYEGYSLYAITDLRLPTDEVHELLCGPGGAFLLDGSNEAIYKVNELAPVRLSPETLPAYLHFFLSSTSSPMGTFILAESTEDIPWMPDANPDDIAEASAKLLPLTLVEHHADDLCLLNATILFRDGLYKSDILVAPCPLTWEGDTEEEEGSMLAGEIRLVNQEMLMDGLAVEIGDDLEEMAGDEGAEDPGILALYEPFPPAAGIDFHEQPAETAAQVVAAMPEEIQPQACSENGFHLTAAELSFYPDYALCALSDPAMPVPNVRFFLAQQGDGGQIVPMNKTNEPIYALNSEETLHLTPETMPLYARFFFFLVQGQLGRFNIAEQPEDVAWLPEATDKDKQTVNELLMPVTYIGLDDQGLHTLKATVLFRNALFRTEIKIAPQPMEVLDPDTNEKEQFSLGQMQLANEELLLEDLPVVT